MTNIIKTYLISSILWTFIDKEAIAIFFVIFLICDQENKNTKEDNIVENNQLHFVCIS